MGEDCNHGHASEESCFYKETARLVEELRRMTRASLSQTHVDAVRGPESKGFSKLAA